MQMKQKKKMHHTSKKCIQDTQDKALNFGPLFTLDSFESVFMAIPDKPTPAKRKMRPRFGIVTDQLGKKKKRTSPPYYKNKHKLDRKLMALFKN